MKHEIIRVLHIKEYYHKKKSFTTIPHDLLQIRHIKQQIAHETGTFKINS